MSEFSLWYSITGFLYFDRHFAFHGFSPVVIAYKFQKNKFKIESFRFSRGQLKLFFFLFALKGHNTGVLG